MNSWSVRGGFLVLLCSVGVGVVGHGCGRKEPNQTERVGVAYGPLVSTAPTPTQQQPTSDAGPALTTLRVALPNGSTLEDIAIGATERIQLGSRGKVTRGSEFGELAVSQVAGSPGQLEVDDGSHVGNIVSSAPVVLGSRVTVSGLVRTSATLEKATDASISAGSQVISPSSPKIVTLSVEFPTESGADRSVSTGEVALPPGRLGNVAIKAGAKLRLSTGSYFFDSLRLLAGGSLVFDNQQGSVFVYVRNALTLEGSTSSLAAKANVLFGYLGSAPVSVAALKGLLLAPNAEATFHAGKHAGAVFARSALLEDDVAFEQVSFSRDDCEEAIDECAEVFGCPLPDGDKDGLSDCAELADDFTSSDPSVFNGVRTEWRPACHSNPAPGLLDTLSEVAACQSAPPIETKAQYSGWDTSGPSSSDICDINRDYQPPWDACSAPALTPARASWSVASTGVIQLEKAGYHCFGVFGDEESHTSGALLFAQETSSITFSSGDRCFNLQPGIYPIRWFYEVVPLGVECEPNHGDCEVNREFSVNYCFGGAKKCEPSAAIPTAMLRPDAGGSGGGGAGCTSASACSASCPCGSGRECTLDRDCTSGLVCAKDNGARYGLARTADVCMPAACSLMSHTVGCGSPEAPCGTCENAKPCGGGYGSCLTGEVCGDKNGAQFGLSSTINVCWSASCSTSGPDSCGTPDSRCGSCVCTPRCENKKCGDSASDGCGDFCASVCKEKEPGCTADIDCGQGLRCVQGGGARIGLPHANVCLKQECTELEPAAQKTAGLCGAESATCGRCPSIAGTCAFRTCGTNPVTGEQCGPGCSGGTVCNGDGTCVVPVAAGELKLAPAAPVQVTTGTTDSIAFDQQSSAGAPVEVPGSLPGTFNVNDAGKATYTIPIAVPAGRLGLQPSLSLSYKSSQAKGPLGVGWGIGGLSAISRCPDIRARQLYPSRVDYDEMDFLCMDGQRLKKVGIGQYRLLPNNLSRISDISDRTQLDVTPSLGAPSGWTAFEVRTKDGRILTYGGTSDSLQLWKGTDHVAVAVWALSKISDRAGNEITFHYNSASSDTSKGCTDENPCGTQEQVLTSVVYGGNANGAGKVIDPRYTVRFDWASLSDNPRQYGSGFRSTGLPTVMSKRLDTIRVLQGDKTIRWYNLTYYSPGAAFGLERLTSVQVCGAMSEDPGSQACFPATKLTYSEYTGGAAFSNTWVSNVTLNAYQDKLIPLDFDGDGRDDLLNIDSSWRIFSAGSSGFSKIYEGVAAAPCISSASVFDFNLDGRNDLLNRCPDQYRSADIYISTPGIAGGAASFKRVSVDLPGVHGGLPLHLLDVDGDGMEDIIQLTDSAVTIWLRDVDHSTIGLADTFREYATVDFPGIVRDAPLFSDVDGDGKKDLMVKLDSDGSWYRYDYRLVDAKHLGTFVRTGVQTGSRDSSGRWTSSVMEAAEGQFHFWDLNGDGLKDLVNYSGHGGAVWLATSMGYRPPTVLAYNSGINRLASHLLTDIHIGLDSNWDGMEDVVSSPSVREPDRWSLERGYYGSLLPALSPGGNHQPEFQAQPGVTPPLISQAYGGDIRKFSAITADVNGDGAPDLIHVNSEWKIAVQFGLNARVNLLTRIENGLGRYVGITYDLSQGSPVFVNPGVAPEMLLSPSVYRGPATPATYDTGPTACHWPIKCLTRAGPLVASHQVGLMNGKLDRRERNFFYSYERAQHDLLGRGELGLAGRKIDEFNANERPITSQELFGIKFTKITFVPNKPGREYYPFAGRVATIQTETPTEGASTAINGGFRTSRKKETALTWALEPSDVLSERFPAVASTLVKVIEGRPDTFPTESLISTTHHQFYYDLYGNVVRETDSVGTSYFDSRPQTQPGVTVQTKRTERQFDGSAERVDEWLISLPLSESVTDTREGEGHNTSITRTTGFEYNDKGLLTAVIREPNSAESTVPDEQRLYLRTEFTPNAVGNVETVVARDAFGNIRTTSATFDPYQIFPQTVTDGKNHSQSVRLDPLHGGATSVIDQNGVTTTLSYDALGQLKGSSDPNGSTTITRTRETSLATDLTLPDVLGIPSIRVKTVSDGSGYRVEDFDAFGRRVRVKTSGLAPCAAPPCSAAPEVIQEYGYNHIGKLAEYSRPHVLGDRSQGNVFRSYDERLRLIEEKTLSSGELGDRVTSYEYASAATYAVVGPIAAPELSRWVRSPTDAELVVRTDPDGHTNTTVTNWDGQLVSDSRSRVAS